MPTYQYACTACDERLEAVQSFTDAPLSQCPACEGALRKVFSAVGVVFKGSGFYKTDSRGKNGAGTKADKSETKADSGSSSTSGSGSGGTSSSTPPAAATSGSGASSPASSGSTASSTSSSTPASKSA